MTQRSQSQSLVDRCNNRWVSLNLSQGERRCQILYQLFLEVVGSSDVLRYQDSRTLTQFKWGSSKRCIEVCVVVYDVFINHLFLNAINLYTYVLLLVYTYLYIILFYHLIYLLLILNIIKFLKYNNCCFERLHLMAVHGKRPYIIFATSIVLVCSNCVILWLTLPP